MKTKRLNIELRNSMLTEKRDVFILPKRHARCLKVPLVWEYCCCMSDLWHFNDYNYGIRHCRYCGHEYCDVCRAVGWGKLRSIMLACMERESRRLISSGATRTELYLSTKMSYLSTLVSEQCRDLSMCHAEGQSTQCFYSSILEVHGARYAG